MVPATDTYMKSFPVLSQMSEGEDGGRKRERGDEVRGGGQKNQHTDRGSDKQHKVNDAQRP